MKKKTNKHKFRIIIYKKEEHKKIFVQEKKKRFLIALKAEPSIKTKINNHLILHVRRT